MSLELPDVSSLSLDPIPPSPTPHSLSSFELLPPELITAILESSQANPGNLATLASLCRTSRHLRSIAHPLLLHSLDVDLEVLQTTLKSLLRYNHPENLKLIRNLKLDLRDGWGRREMRTKPTKDQLEAIEALLRGATELKVFNGAEYPEFLTSLGQGRLNFLCLHDEGLTHNLLNRSSRNLRDTNVPRPRVSTFPLPRAPPIPIVRFWSGSSLLLSPPRVPPTSTVHIRLYETASRAGEVLLTLSTLRHLTFSPTRTPLSERERLFLEFIAPHLDSALLPFANIDDLPPSVTSSPSISRTYFADIADVDEFPEYQDQIEHLKIDSFLMSLHLFGKRSLGEDVAEMSHQLGELARWIDGGNSKLRTLELILDQIDAYPLLVEPTKQVTKACVRGKVQLKWRKSS